MSSYCPFKKSTAFQTKYGSLIEYESQRVALTDIYFGQCEGSKCMAYDSDDGTCKLMRMPHATIIDNSGEFPWA